VNNYALSKSFKVSGKGIHTGVETTVTVHPGETGRGYTLKRLDLPNSDILKISPKVVSDTERRTTLSNGSTTAHTAEHLLLLFMVLIYMMPTLSYPTAKFQF